MSYSPINMQRVIDADIRLVENNKILLDNRKVANVFNVIII